MYKSLYDYVGKDKGALPVRAGEQFRFIERHDKNWWKMRSENGSVGLVPACYMEAVDSEKVDPSETLAVLESVDRAIEVIHIQATNAGGIYTHEQRAHLRKLLERRARLLSGKSSPARSPTSSDVYHAGAKSKTEDAAQEPPAQPRRPAPTLPPDKDKKEKKKESTKRRPAPAAPVSTAKQAGETKGAL